MRRYLPLVLLSLAVLTVGSTSARTASPPNPIVLENQQPGTTSWQFTDYNKAENHEIEGYASATSVDKGGSINFMVSLSASATYTMDFYRMGWYPTGTNPDGSSCAPSCGGRLMLHVGPLNGFKQAACPMVTSSSDVNYGMVECNWTPSYSLSVPSTWTQGVYLVKLTRLDGSHLQSYMTFVVRDDSSTAPVLYSLDTNTWQAYNFWGGAGNNNLGINLYGRFNDVTLNTASGSRAYTVSFDRPYLVQGSTDGAGNFFVWDFPLVRWMESQGYDMTYVTDTELEASPSLLTGHRVFVNTGHDEYYSDTMKAALQNGIAAGTNLALFSANNVYFRVTWQADGNGQSLRRIHTSKGSLADQTTEWRNLTPAQPENALLGVMQNGVASDRPYLVYDASSWIYAGTGLVNYTGNGTTGVVTSGAGQNALPGIIGYEFDERAANASSLSPFASSEPPGLQQVGHSFVPASDNGVAAWSDATLYTAPSGATVFSAGTIQWPYTVDNGYADGFCDCDHHVANAAGQRITANILSRFGAPATPTPVATWSPSSLSFASQTTGTTSAAKNVTFSNGGSAPMTISSIAVTGANASDFAQTSTCPLAPATLAVNASCTISVSFSPTATGSRTASLAVTDDAPASPQTVALTGTGAAPAPGATLTPTTLAFGNQSVGATSAPMTSSLKNTGTGPLTISSIVTGGTRATDYAQTNDCPISPATLAVNATCTITVTFKPLATGSRAATVTVTDNASSGTQRITLSGTGVTSAAAVTLAPTSLSFGSQRVGTTSAAQTVTVTDSGTAPLTITSVAASGDYAQTSTCPVSPSTLAAGASCTVSVTFTPTAGGTRSGTLSVTDNAAGSPHTATLGGTGTAPAVALSPGSLTFASQPTGTTSAAQASTLTNTGNAPLSISSIGVTGANAADFAATSTCPLAPATLAASASCSVSVTFTPTATGPRTASVSIGDDAAGSPQALTLSGTGAAVAPLVTLNPTSLSFDAQPLGTTSAAKTATLTNSGNAALTITSVTASGDFAQTSTCPASLAAGTSCTISVTFTPTAPGTRTGSVSIADNAAGSPQALGLTGSGSAPAVGLTPASLTFGSQLVGTTSGAQPVTVTNTGGAPLTISSIGLAGANASEFGQTSTCPASPATLAAGASCTISVTFSPSAAGTRSASLQVADDATGSPQAVGLTGTGATPAPAVGLAPASLDLGQQRAGTTSAAKTATLTNTGTAPLSIASIGVTGANAAEFAEVDNCPDSPVALSVGASCTISVTFTPSATGSRTAAVTIADDAADSPQALPLAGTGTVPAATLTPSSLTFGAQSPGSTSAPQTTTLKNTGTGLLTIGSIGVTGANASEFAQTSTCPAQLAAGSTCTISVTFTPSTVGVRSASLSVADDAADSPQLVPLTGTGSTATIAFDRNLGQKNENAGSTTMTLTTSGAAAAQTRVFAFVDWYHASRTLTSVSGGGLTWTIDVQGKDTTNYHAAIASAYAPSGLASGTVLTATFSGSVTHGLIAAASFGGIASTGAVDVTGTTAGGGVTAWTTSVTTTNANDLVLGWSGIDTASASTASTPTAPSTEIHDFGDTNLGEHATSVYRIESATGAKTVAGTWASLSGSTASITVAAAYRGG